MKKYNLKSSNGQDKKNDPLRTKLAHYLSIGLSIDDARKLTDCSKNKFEELRLNPEFDDFIQTCLLKNKETYLQAIRDAATSGYYQAAQWYLERKFPEEFGKKDLVRHEYTVKLQTFQKIVVDVINQESPEIRARIMKRLRDYKYVEGSCMDHSFQPRQLPKMEVEINEEEL